MINYIHRRSNEAFMTVRKLLQVADNQGDFMNKNVIIVILVVALGAGLYLYNKEQNTTTIKLGDAKIEIEE